MPRVRKPTADEIRARRRALHETVGQGGLPYAEAIRQMRAATGMTQARFAQAFRLTPRQVVELETGKANPTVETLARLGKTFGFQVGFVRPRSGSLADRVPGPDLGQPRDRGQDGGERS